MIGYGDRYQTQEEVVELFNINYPNGLIIQLAESKLERRLQETGTVDEDFKVSRPKINNEAKLIILLAMEIIHITALDELAKIKIAQLQLHKKLEIGKVTSLWDSSDPRIFQRWSMQTDGCSSAER